MPGAEAPPENLYYHVYHTKDCLWLAAGREDDHEFRNHPV